MAYFDKDDIPGKNSFLPAYYGIQEELFCNGKVLFYFQPIGIVLAENQEIAEEAVELVEVTYEESSKQPLLTIRDVIKADAKERITNEMTINPKSKGN